MARSRKGSGSVFQRTYRNAKGKLCKTTNWYIEFVQGNRTVREATELVASVLGEPLVSTGAAGLRARLERAMGGDSS